jgi:hypothetical protein
LLTFTANSTNNNKHSEACTGFCGGNMREIDHWGDPGLDGRIILRWIFWMWDVGLRTGLCWLRIGKVGVHL